MSHFCHFFKLKLLKCIKIDNGDFSMVDEKITAEYVGINTTKNPKKPTKKVLRAKHSHEPINLNENGFLAISKILAQEVIK